MKKTTSGHQGPVISFAICHNGTYLVNGSTDDTIKIWDTTSYELIKIFGHRNDVTALTVLSNGYLASGSNDGLIFI